MRSLHFHRPRHTSSPLDTIFPRLLLLTIPILASFCLVNSGYAGPYTDSAHGNATYGVYRSSTKDLGYARGNCAHCHELKGSINGSEPDPAGGAPSPSALFYDNNVSQTDNVCLQCHTDASSFQFGGIVNRSYSYRAGGWTSDPVNDTEQSFSFLPPGTSHNLNDILEFIKTQAWGYSATSNPCVACHNPHALQGDPANAGNSVKASGSRGTPISLPNLHQEGSGGWGLWGDGAGETMSTYNTYQAPYRYDLSTADGFDNGFEPQGDTIKATAAANTTNYVAFCSNCHNGTNTIYSTTLGRNLRYIDWENEKHGEIAASSPPKSDSGGDSDLTDPYINTTSYVLSCLDCHEPHGSSNTFLLRPEVNGRDGVTITTEESTANGPGPYPNDQEWVYLCEKCHTRLGFGDGHTHPDFLPPDSEGDCSSAACHYTMGAYNYYTFACGFCHYHGSVSPTDPTNPRF